MKRLLPLVLLVICGAAQLPGEELPVGIVSYYDDWNFVMANSTPNERNSIWGLAQRDSANALSSREQSLLRIMERLNGMKIIPRSVMPGRFSGIQFSESYLFLPLQYLGDLVNTVQLVVAVIPIPPKHMGSVANDSWPISPDTVTAGNPTMGRMTHRWRLEAEGWRMSPEPALKIGDRRHGDIRG